VAIDTTGIKGTIGGQYRGRKRFLKLHSSVNIKTNQVVGYLFTTDQVSDCKGFLHLIFQSQALGKIESAYLNKAYDSAENYFMLQEQQIEAFISPRRTMPLYKVQLRLRI
jgi:hypothetical protein